MMYYYNVDLYGMVNGRLWTMRSVVLKKDIDRIKKYFHGILKDDLHIIEVIRRDKTSKKMVKIDEQEIFAGIFADAMRKAMDQKLMNDFISE